MSCLDNYIGIKSCSIVPTSGEYINTLPGMSTELVNAITNGEQATLVQTWKDIQTSSYDKFVDDIANFLREKKAVKFDEVILQTPKLDMLSREIEIIPASNTYRGVYFRLPMSKYTAIYLKGVHVYSESAISTTLKVWDVNDGTELLSQDIDLVEGVNYVDINETLLPKFDSAVMFVGIDATNLVSVKTSRNGFLLGDDDCACAYSKLYPISTYEYYPAYIEIGEEVVYTNLQQEGNGMGVELDADMMCSVDQFICQNKKRLKTAWKYLLAFQTLLTKKNSYKLNMFTTSNLEASAQLMSHYEKEYNNSLDRALEVIPNNDFCLSCDGTLNVYYGGSIA